VSHAFESTGVHGNSIQGWINDVNNNGDSILDDADPKIDAAQFGAAKQPVSKLRAIRGHDNGNYDDAMARHLLECWNYLDLMPVNVIEEARYADSHARTTGRAGSCARACFLVFGLVGGDLRSCSAAIAQYSPGATHRYLSVSGAGRIIDDNLPLPRGVEFPPDDARPILVQVGGAGDLLPHAAFRVDDDSRNGHRLHWHRQAAAPGLAALDPDAEYPNF